MPRVRALIRPDPIDVEVKTTIGRILAVGGMTIKDLSKRTGINESTLRKKIGPSGNIGELRLKEYKKIKALEMQLGIDEGK